MAHAAAPAAAVVVAEAVIAPDQAVAREYQQVLEPLVALAGRADRRYGRSRPAVPGRDAAIRREVVVVGEVGDVYADDQLRCGPGPYAGNRHEALVRGLALEEPAYLGIEPRRLGDGLPDPPGKHHDLGILCGDPAFRRTGRAADRIQGGIDPAGGDALRGRLQAPLARIGDAPRAAQPLQGGEPSAVAHVHQGLERGAAFQQDAPQPVLVAGRGRHHVIALGCQHPGRVELLVGLRDRLQRFGYPQRGLGDDQRVPLVGLGVAREQPGCLVRGDSGQVGHGQPGRHRPRYRQRADVAALVDDHQGLRADLGEQGVELVFRVGHAPVQDDFARPRGEAGPMR